MYCCSTKIPVIKIMGCSRSATPFLLSTVLRLHRVSKSRYLNIAPGQTSSEMAPPPPSDYPLCSYCIQRNMMPVQSPLQYYFLIWYSPEIIRPLVKLNGLLFHYLEAPALTAPNHSQCLDGRSISPLSIVHVTECQRVSGKSSLSIVDSFQPHLLICKPSTLATMGSHYEQVLSTQHVVSTLLYLGPSSPQQGST